MKWNSKLEDLFRRKRNAQTAPSLNATQPTSRPVDTHIEPIPINFNLKALVVTDGHGSLYPEDIPHCDADVCFLLGDLSLRDIAIVKEKIGNMPVYGILGNHDGFELYDRAGIENIHGKVVEVNGVKIAGMQGSLRYKDTEFFPFYTDDESVEIAEQIDAA